MYSLLSFVRSQQVLTSIRSGSVSRLNRGQATDKMAECSEGMSSTPSLSNAYSFDGIKFNSEIQAMNPYGDILVIAALKYWFTNKPRNILFRKREENCRPWKPSNQKKTQALTSTLSLGGRFSVPGSSIEV